ncbi:hypothetical protein GOODEAATRI_016973 [Goodea atripinnis]|uniref:Uncharacterized protein n=1 Tax=Goodea atripinnis TaxID=208336 RepID=A0ABV0PYN6_9TELE
METQCSDVLEEHLLELKKCKCWTHIVRKYWKINGNGLLLDEHVATRGKRTPPLTGRNLQQNQNQAQCERPSATTNWGFERTEQRHKENSVCLLWLVKLSASKLSAR